MKTLLISPNPEHLQTIHAYCVANFEEACHFAKSLELAPLFLDQADMLIVDSGQTSPWLDEQLVVYRGLAQTSPLLLVNHDMKLHQALAHLEAGAKGILGVDCVTNELEQAFSTLLNGDIYLTSDFIQSLAMRQIQKMLLPFKELTSREFDLLCLLAEGYSLAYIAEQMQISSKTVSNCQTELKRKLGMQDRHNLITLAKRHGIIVSL